MTELPNKPMRNKIAFLATSLSTLSIVFLIIYILFSIFLRNSGSTFFIQPDSGDYFSPASHLAENGIFSRDGTTPSAKREIMIPFVISSFIKTGLIKPFECSPENLFPFIIFQILLYVISLWMLGKIAQQVFNKRVAVLTMIFGFIYIPLAQFQFQVLSEALAIFFITSCAFLGQKYIYEKRVRYILFSGLCLGLAGITKSVFVLFPPILFGILIYHEKKKLPAIAFLVVSLALPIGWVVRNYMHFDQFVLSTDGPSAFYRGNIVLGRAFPSEKSLPDVFKKPEGLSEIESYAYFKKQSLDLIFNRPFHLILQFFYKLFVLLFGLPSSLKYTVLLSIRFLFLAFVLSRIKIHLNNPLIIMVGILTIYNIFFYSIIHSTPRYFAPCVFLLIPQFIESITYWFSKFTSRLWAIYKSF